MTSSSAGGPGPAVVVPVHDAPESVQRCLDSLREHTPDTRILLLDDGSRDPAIRPLLRSVAADDGRFRVVEQPRALGYTATVNRGLREAEPRDVVLLNSDTRVSPGWLDSLREVALGRPGVATVTPISNAAGAFSVPVRGRRNPLPAGWSVEDLAARIRALAKGLVFEVPTGHGFCLYVRRAALEEVGSFDEETFPSGVGEENDFCLRASGRGWIHLVDAGTFVFHEGSASLGWRKRWLLLRARWILRRRYPEYFSRVADWLRDDPLDRLREDLAPFWGPSSDP